MEPRTEPITHLLPIHNGAEYVAQALQAISRNSIPTDAVFIIDDGSTDNTYEEIVKNSVGLPNLRVSRSSGLGLVRTLNRGILDSKTEWIARWDVDDQYSDNRIQVQLASVNPDVVAVFADYEFRIIGKFFAGRIPSPITPLATLFSLVSSQQTAHPSVIYRRESVIKAGMYRQEDFPAEDLGLWLRLSNLGDLISVPQTLLRYNLSTGSTSAQRRNEAIQKSLALINAHKVDLNRYLALKSSFRSTLNTYSQFPFADIRLFLFFRNAKKAESVWGLEVDSKLPHKELLIRKIGYTLVLIKILPWVLLRRVFRKFNFPK